MNIIAMGTGIGAPQFVLSLERSAGQTLAHMFITAPPGYDPGDSRAVASFPLRNAGDLSRLRAAIKAIQIHHQQPIIPCKP